jgi:hypothetical protein
VPVAVDLGEGAAGEEVGADRRPKGVAAAGVEAGDGSACAEARDADEGAVVRGRLRRGRGGVPVRAEAGTVVGMRWGGTQHRIGRRRRDANARCGGLVVWRQSDSVEAWRGGRWIDGQAERRATTGMR